MPFGMGPAGWFMWPYMAQWLQYGYPYYGYSYGTPFYGYPGYIAPYPSMPKEQEISMLQDQAKAMEDELNRIRLRIEELQKAE